MKLSFKTFVFVLTIALTGTVKSTQAEISHVQIAQAQKAEIHQLIVLALPMNADVLLKDGSSATGQMTKFDSKEQIIEISRSGESRKLQIAKVQKVTFKTDALTYTSDGKRVIRGEDNSQAVQSIWDDIPLNAFQLLNSSLGKASVDLATVMNPKRLREISSVAQNSLYIANEIDFKPQGNMKITVTPTDRPR